MRATERLQWALGDVTEPQFYKSWIASLCLLAGAAFAWRAASGDRYGRWSGQPISYGSGLWPWVLFASFLSLALANAVLGPSLRSGWQPTFVPVVSVAPAVVLLYGPGWATAVTGAALGAGTAPLAVLLIDGLAEPLGLPAVVACTAAMSAGAVLAFVVCRRLPWLELRTARRPQPPGHVARGGLGDAVWAARRVLLDFSEAQFYANEWASLGLLAGLAVTAFAVPGLAAYGSGLLPEILFAQALTSAAGVVMWRRHYRDGGWAATYASVAPASVLAHPGSAAALALGALLGAAICPPVARAVSAALPTDFHPFVGNTVAMAVCTASTVPALGLVL